ncbi:MAG TPA: pyridoxal phosphate-dependent aminotransferase [Candidatus Methanoperedens sp.]|nr:pyridoxal phosphate-dependent aminotransferase [Candidatus Methanoperedens sp.]
MKLTSRLSEIVPSATLALTARANALKAQGVDIVGFGAGEPDFDTPAPIKQAAIAALEAGFTKYTPTAGIPELREEISRKLREDNGLAYEPSQVLVSCGAKHSLFNFFQAALDPGDEVLIPSPYWVSYPEMVRLAGGRPVFVPSAEKEGFRLLAAAVRPLIGPRTKVLIVNSPSNPTGCGLELMELEALAALAVEHDLFVVSDEIYEPLTYDGFRHVSIAALGPEIKKRTLVVNGFSKSYSMTGWRLGYAAGEKGVIAAMTTVQDHSTSNATSFAQKGAVAALRGPKETLREWVAEFAARKDRITQLLRRIPGVTLPEPQGAFYAFANFSSWFGRAAGAQRIDGSLALSDYLLSEAQVAIVPGAAFGSDAHLRFSFALSRERIGTGIERVAAALARLG